MASDSFTHMGFSAAFCSVPCLRAYFAAKNFNVSSKQL